MEFGEKRFMLKDGRAALLRSPGGADAEEMLRFIRCACGETEFLLKYPEEYAGFTAERERAFLQSVSASPGQVMIACFVGDRVAGNGEISFRGTIKERHRAGVAIAVLREFWGLGIGTGILGELCRLAEEREGIRQVELEFIEGNSRARGLYEKMGFRITGVIPDAVRFRDGSYVNEYMMMKRLESRKG